jgi:glycosyltransferase involved in cell wall biosynthesis
MFVSGLTIIRNGVKLQYPFLESIQAMLPICDEFIAVVGDCEDDTRARIVALGSDKIRIVDTVWDPKLREGGRVLAQQTNVGLDEAKGDWIFYLQADEMIHEKDLHEIRQEMEANLNDTQVEGLLFPYHHFWTYDFVTVTRRAYRREVRVVRNLPGLRSYRDAQGFRIFSSKEASELTEPGRKLKVKLIRPHVFAYGRVRPPKEEHAKVLEFVKLWQSDEEIAKRFKGKESFDYEHVDHVEPFPAQGHPALMAERIRLNTYHITPKLGHFKFKNRILYWIERLTGYRVAEYRNYQIVKRA